MSTCLNEVSLARNNTCAKFVANIKNMAGWKQAERHINHASQSASLYGKYYHWIMMAFRATIAFIMSRRVFDTKIQKDIECDTRMIGCLQDLV